jgi:DNA polymerase-3 subunit delta'
MMISAENNVIKIDQMRVLKQTAYLKPMTGKKRFFVVTDADRMNDEASNSLLKVLEEPPSFSHIILITSNPDMIKPTIKSRCQTLNFQPISREDIEKILLEKGFGMGRAKVISLLVRGNLKKALSLDWEEVQSRRAKAWKMLLSLYGEQKVADFLRSYSFSRGQIKEELGELIELLSSFCRDLILIQERGNSKLLMNPDYKDKYVKATEFLTLQRSMDCLEKMDYALYALQKNLNVNLLLTSLFSEGSRNV